MLAINGIGSNSIEAKIFDAIQAPVFTGLVVQIRRLVPAA
jgi:hypothetical protein